MSKPLSVAQKGFLAVLILVVLELSFVLVLTAELHSLQSRLERERHARSIMEHLNRFTSAAQKTAAELVKALPVAKPIREEIGLGLYKDELASMRRELRSLKELLKDDAEGLQLLNQLELRTAEEESSFDYLLQLRPEEIQSKLTKVLDPGDKLTALCDRLMERYQHIDDLSVTEQSLQRVEIVLAVGVLFGLAANLVAIMFFLKQVANRLSIISENMSRFEQQQELLPEQNQGDEIAEIDRAFHRLTSALEQASEQERMLIEHSSDVVCSIDTRGVILTASQAASQQWGYEPEELIGVEIEILIPEGLSAQFEKLTANIASESDLSFEKRLIRKDNLIIDTLWSAHWSPSDGSLFCCVRDITESKQMDNIVSAREEQLRKAIENMPIGIVTTDTKGTIKSANKIGQELLMLDVTAGTRTTIAEYLAPLDQGSTIQYVTVENANPLRCSIVQPGEQASKFVDLTLLRSQYKVDETLILLDDTTERHVLEQMKKNLVNLLGTTLQKPLLNVHSIVTRLIEKQAFDQPRRDRLKRIQGNIRRLLALIEQLIDVERLGVGNLIGEKKPCLIADVVSAAVDSTKDYAEQQRIELVCDKDACHGSIMGDAQRLVQVVINLITNAIKYSPANTMVTVTVTAGETDLEIKISDRGRGVPQEMRKTIFEPFVQTQSSDGRRGAGTGLGLSICKQIIEGHEGRIGVDGREDGGSIFWIELPKHSDDSSP